MAKGTIGSIIGISKHTSVSYQGNSIQLNLRNKCRHSSRDRKTLLTIT